MILNKDDMGSITFTPTLFNVDASKRECLIAAEEAEIHFPPFVLLGKGQIRIHSWSRYCMEECVPRGCFGFIRSYQYVKEGPLGVLQPPDEIDGIAIGRDTIRIWATYSHGIFAFYDAQWSAEFEETGLLARH